MPELAVTSGTESWLLWAGFGLFVVLMLVLDLKVFHRHAHAVRTSEALAWSVAWVSLALAFGAGVWIWLGREKAAEFLTAYLVEKSLSVDNLFVFVVLFHYFRVPGELQHRVLFLGVLGAIVLRLLFILGGAAMLERWHWTTFAFGGILVLTAGKLLVAGDSEPDPSQNLALRAARRWLRFSPDYAGDALTVVRDGVRYGTPLLLVLIVVEATDVVFAVDSVPACLAISSDAFIVFTSNIFAILGLRALYFLLARYLGSFRFLKYGLAVVLAFIGVKMVLQGIAGSPPFPTWVSLTVIGSVLTLATVASLLMPEGAREELAPPAQATSEERPVLAADRPVAVPVHE